MDSSFASDGYINGAGGNDETVQYLDCIPNTTAGQVKLLRLLRMIKLLRLNRLKQAIFLCASASVTVISSCSPWHEFVVAACAP